MSAKGRKWSEEQKKAWSEKCQATRCNNGVWTETRKNQLSKRSKKLNATLWTKEKRAEHSKVMSRAVIQNPDSYSKNNVSGRVKMYDVMSSTGQTRVKGKWELYVAEWLNNHSVRWTNDVKPYSYQWNEKWHLYFPDFHLLDYDVVLEVKGFQTERDLAKWKSVTDKKFVVLKDHKQFDEILRATVLLNWLGS